MLRHSRIPLGDLIPSSTELTANPVYQAVSRLWVIGRWFENNKSFRLEVSKRWLRVLFRRSQKSRVTWKRLAVFVEQWLPTAKILHPYPTLRFAAKYLR